MKTTTGSLEKVKSSAMIITILVIIFAVAYFTVLGPCSVDTFCSSSSNLSIHVGANKETYYIKRGCSGAPLKCKFGISKEAGKALYNAVDSKSDACLHIPFWYKIDDTNTWKKLNNSDCPMTLVHSMHIKGFPRAWYSTDPLFTHLVEDVKSHNIFSSGPHTCKLSSNIASNIQEKCKAGKEKNECLKEPGIYVNCRAKFGAGCDSVQSIPDMPDYS